MDINGGGLYQRTPITILNCLGTFFTNKGGRWSHVGLRLLYINWSVLISYFLHPQILMNVWRAQKSATEASAPTLPGRTSAFALTASCPPTTWRPAWVMNAHHTSSLLDPALWDLVKQCTGQLRAFARCESWERGLMAQINESACVKGRK